MDPSGRQPTWEAELIRLIQLGRDREAAELAALRLLPSNQGDPMDPRRQLDELFPLLNKLVADLEPQQLANPTPCAEFTVAQVLEHMIGGATSFASAFRGTPPVAPAATIQPPDLVTLFPAAMAGLQSAVGSEGALERIISSPFGEVPGEAFARFVALDGLVHGWDLATATGQRYEPRDSLVAEVESFARVAITEAMRDGETFALPTPAPPDAAPIVKLAAFTGRSV